MTRPCRFWLSVAVLALAQALLLGSLLVRGSDATRTSKGSPRDAKSGREKDEDWYTRALQGESFETSAYNTYGTAELLLRVGGMGAYDTGNFVVVDLLAHTRRFRKLLKHVDKAKADGTSAETVAVLAGTIRALMAERERVFAELAGLARERPHLFDRAAALSEEERYELSDRIRGHVFAAPNAPPGLLPVGLDGAKLAIATNLFLLGYTEHPDAVASILSVARHTEGDDRQTVRDAFQSRTPIPALDLQNWFVIGDALDRAMVASADNEGLPPETRELAREYVQWRLDRDWPAREKATVVAYDDPFGDPHSVNLCMRFGRDDCRDADCPDGVNEIIGWAERFEQTRRSAAQ